MMQKKKNIESTLCKFFLGVWGGGGVEEGP